MNKLRENMKKKPKILKLSLFTLKDDTLNETHIPCIKSLCWRFGSKELNTLWHHHWDKLNNDEHTSITEYLNKDIQYADWQIRRPYVYLLRVMVLHDFCRLHGYKLEDIKYE